MKRAGQLVRSECKRKRTERLITCLVRRHDVKIVKSRRRTPEARSDTSNHVVECPKAVAQSTLNGDFFLLCCYDIDGHATSAAGTVRGWRRTRRRGCSLNFTSDPTNAQSTTPLLLSTIDHPAEPRPLGREEGCSSSVALHPLTATQREQCHQIRAACSVTTAGNYLHPRPLWAI